ncbi:MAG TPA: hypothetical protein VFB58_06450 [Chloroflexota bacterium]|nr:hypothetical protein [Chloroflexota bacterium]
MTSHGEFLRQQGAEDEIVTGIAHDFRGAPITEKTTALLDFTYKLSQTPAEITRADWEALLAAGWTEQQAIEAAHIVGMFEYYNRVAEAFGMESHGIQVKYLLEDAVQGPQQRSETS